MLVKMYCTFVVNLTIVIFLSTYLPCYSLRVNSSESILIVALPLVSNGDESVSWERGVEILPGAFKATERLNNDTQIDMHIKLIVVDSGPATSTGYSYSGSSVLEVIAALTLQNRFADIIGIAGVMHPNVLLTLKSFGLPIASLVHFGGMPHSPSMFYMTASTSVVTDSLVSLMSRFNQNDIGLITDIHHSYFARISSELGKKANLLYIQVGHERTELLSNVPTRIAKTSVKFILLAASKSISLRVLCEAHKKGLTWPKYAWIMLSFRLDDESQSFDKCRIHSVMEGIIILELAEVQKKRHTFLFLGGNPYAHVLHDAICALTLATVFVNNKSTSQLNTVQYGLDVGYSKIYIYQVFNGTLVPSGSYDSEVKLLTNFTINSLSIELSPFLPLPYLMILPLLCCAFNTVLLALFLYFRDEPDVKSSSVSLTMIMFIGCYLFVAFVIGLIVGVNLDIDLCMVRVSSLSLCVALILATLLVKMLRVYHIFTLRGYEKPSIFLYNSALFVYTMLIIAPKVYIVILWSVVDKYQQEPAPRSFASTDSSESIVLRTVCKSNHTIIWTALLAVYDTILSLSVVTVAVKTRKIRFARFKDTKKVNLLVFLVLFIGISTWLYWYVFNESRRYALVPTYILYAGCIALPFVCQFTLFVPKIWNPVYKKVCN